MDIVHWGVWGGGGGLGKKNIFSIILYIYILYYIILYIIYGGGWGCLLQYTEYCRLNNSVYYGIVAEFSGPIFKVRLVPNDVAVGPPPQGQMTVSQHSKSEGCHPSDLLCWLTVIWSGAPTDSLGGRPHIANFIWNGRYSCLRVWISCRCLCSRSPNQTRRFQAGSVEKW